MKKWAPWIIATLVLSALIHVIIVAGLPYGIMAALSTKSPGEPNTIYHAAPVTAESRKVVRPGPGLLYSACPFDVRKGALKITSPVPPGTYFSISAFAANTDNFFVINDRQVESDTMEIYLVRPGTKLAAKGEGKVVEVPTERGLVLFRTAIKNDQHLQQLLELRKKAKCEWFP